jgi:hypothetical protein
MKALTKTLPIALVLSFTLIDTADARPKAPGRNDIVAVGEWCNLNGGYFGGAGPNCYECLIKGSGGKSDLYTCCVGEESIACAWRTCFDSPGGLSCYAAKTPDVLPNVLLESLRSQSLIKVPAQPDLVPLPQPASVPPEGFCRRNEQGQLVVRIYNQGGVDAPATKTRVQFGSGAPTDLDTPPIAAGKGTDLVINIPNGCYDVNNKCAFGIGADAAAASAESNEANNNAAGVCGPQFF